MDHPRILIVAAASLCKNSGTGITLSNLFEGYSPSSICQICMDAADPDPNLCGSFQRLGTQDIFVDRLVRPMLFRLGLVSGKPSNSRAPASAPVAKSSGGRFKLIRLVLRAHADLLPYPVLPRIIEWGERFDPDIIYTLSGSIRMNRLALALSRRLQRPLLVHFMDDWISTYYRETVLNWLPRFVLVKTTRAVVERSRAVLCISDAMAKEYRQSFGKPCEAFMNCVEVGNYTRSQSQGCVRFTYVGGLHLERWRSLVQLGKVIDELAVGSSVNCELVVHAPKADISLYGSDLEKCKSIRMGRTLLPSEISAVLQESDVLVHVESFLPSVARYCRLSVSTKVPQYLAAGRPILCYGPSSLASIQYVRDYQTGLVVGEQDPAALASTVKRLRDDTALRMQLGTNGWKLALRQHSASDQRKRLVDTIRKFAK